MNPEIKARLRWVKLYEETGDAGHVCRRCGISKPTLWKWGRRYKKHGFILSTTMSPASINDTNYL